MKFKSVKWKNKPKPKIYRKSRVFDRTCRNHGSCPWCKGNRLYSTRKRELEANLEIEEAWKRLIYARLLK